MSWGKYAFLKLLDKIDFIGYGHSHLSQRHCDAAGSSEPKNLVMPAHLQSGESACPFPPKGHQHEGAPESLRALTRDRNGGIDWSTQLHLKTALST